MENERAKPRILGLMYYVEQKQTVEMKVQAGNKDQYKYVELNEIKRETKLL